MDTIEISTSEAEAKFIREKLNEYNTSHVPPDNHETLNLIVRQDDRIIAGLVGDTYWDWLYISVFWVDPGQRVHGLGSRILARAEEIAVQRGCRNAHLETHDFQNLEFYLRRGFIIFGKLEDLPAGHTKFYLRKSLVQ
jgi:GNAT superfamily N-acetyltransferase